jgi:hypothetical protein
MVGMKMTWNARDIVEPVTSVTTLGTRQVMILKTTTINQEEPIMNHNYRIFMLLGYIKAKIGDLSQRSQSYGNAASVAITEFEAYFDKEVDRIFRDLQDYE